MASRKTSKRPTVSGLSEQAQKDVKSARAYISASYQPKWTQAWQLYRGERVKIGYQSQSGVNLFDPMTYNNVETNVSHQFSEKPRVVYLPTKPEQQRETRALNQLIGYTWDKNNLSREIIPAGRELNITGMFTFWDTWDADTDWIKTDRRAINDCIFDPNASNKETLRYGGYRYLTMKDELYDVMVLDPETGDRVPKYAKEDIDLIPTWTNGEDPEIDKSLKDCYEGSTLDGEAKCDQIEMTVLYYVKGKYAGKVIELANREVSLYDGDSQFQKKAEKRRVHVAQYDKNNTPKTEPMQNPDGSPNPNGGKPVFKLEEVNIPEIKPFIPVWIQRDTIDGQMFYGMGQVEPNADNQELLNDTITQKRDNVTANINAMVTVDPKFKDMVPKIKNIPNAVYAIPPEAIKWVEKPDMTGAADIEIQRIKESMRNTAAIDEVTAGLAPEHQSTATQINTQMGQYDKRTSIKLQGLENEAFKQMADNWYKMFRIFVTDKQVLRITGRKGVDWLELDPDMYWGDYEPQVTLEQNARAARDDEIKRIESVANILMNNPYVDQKELTRVVTTRLLEFDDDEADTLMVKDSDLQAQQAPQGALPPGMPQGAPQGPQMPGVPNMPNGQLPANPVAMAAMAKAMAGSGDNEGPKSVQERIIESIDYADLPEDAKQAVLSQQLGIESRMASPAQQEFNLKAMQLQHDQTKHDLATAQAAHGALLNEHKALLDTHAAHLQATQQQHQQGLDVAQHQMSAQNQEFTQGHTQETAKFDQKMRQKELARPAGGK